MQQFREIFSVNMQSNPISVRIVKSVYLSTLDKAISEDTGFRYIITSEENINNNQIYFINFPAKIDDDNVLEQHLSHGLVKALPSHYVSDNFIDLQLEVIYSLIKLGVESENVEDITNNQISKSMFVNVMNSLIESFPHKLI